MTPEFSKATLKKLQAMKRADETIELVVRRLIDAYEGKKVSQQPHRKKKPVKTGNATLPPLAFAPDSVPDLTFSKCLSVTIDGEELRNPNWNSTIRAIVKKINPADLRPSFYGLQIKDGKMSGKKGGYIKELKKSVKTVDANTAARIIFEMAKDYRLSMKIEFRWRDKKGAEFPERRGIISIK